MKRFSIRSASAVMAAVMAVSAMGITTAASGWTETENSTKYLRSDGSELSGGKYNIGGTIYEFSEEGYCVGEFSGWVKSGGVKRRYNKGVPYTGWLKTSDGVKKYCLDGYLVTGELQIGDYEYRFNDEGHLSGQTSLSISADCGKVTTDTETITIKLTMLEDGAQSFGAPVLLEKWENGEWVDCFGDSAGAIPMTLQLYSMSKAGETTEVQFNSIYHTGYKLTPGYYRIPINNTADSGFSFAMPIAVVGDDGTAMPVDREQSEPSVSPVSTYAMFKV